MDRRTFVTASTASLAGLLLTRQTLFSDSERPPNFVILFADDMGYGDLSCYGHPTIRTPFLDRMAAEGMKLTQFYAAASVCTPSRAGLLTGRLPVRSGMCSDKRAVLFPDSNGGLPDDEITIAKALKQKDYATACIGKWHLGHKHPYLPTDHGFDTYFGIPYSNDMSPAQSKWDGAQKFPPTPLLEDDRTIEQEPDQSMLTRRYTERAIHFIENNQSRPFFLYLPYTFPHTPLYASDKFKDQSPRGLYGDVVEELDWSVGQILDRLTALDLAENTLVIFTSDNGPWLMQGENGGSSGLLKEGKFTTWEGGMREPAVAWWPGVIAPGSISHGLASTLDIFTTCLTLAGAAVPVDRVIDGVDLTPILKQQKSSVRESLFYYRQEQLYAVRFGPWKAHFQTITEPYSSAIHKMHDPPLLYHLERDPSEKENQALLHPEIIETIKQLVSEHQNNLVRRPSMLDL